MTVRADVAELLAAGYGDRTIARRLGVTAISVTKARTELGLPKARGGHKPAASIEDLFWKHAKPVDGGHYQWTGSHSSKGTPQVKWGGRDRETRTAYRVAYRIRHGADPAGYCFPACGFPRCVAPEHIADSKAAHRPAHHDGGRGQTSDFRRDEIVALLRKGQSNKSIAQTLQVDPKRVQRIRIELGLPRATSVRAQGPTLEEKWAAAVRPAGGGHVRWTGAVRGTTPNLVHGQRNHSGRAVGFAITHGRQPVGRVLPGCGTAWCVAGEHATDGPMRRANSLYAGIFGRAA
jgi:DNA-binding CsgD family transcriptional regulator